YYLINDTPGTFLAAGCTLIAVIGSVRLGRKTSPAARFGGAVVNLVAAPVLALGLLHGMNVLYVF
ncbi:MAG TPA: hypothetical protein VGF17_08270, partial [Phytomonospora sp.]